MEKLGMRREGVARSCLKGPRPGHPRIDVVSYGLLREEWEQAAVGQPRLCSVVGGHAAEDQLGAEGTGSKSSMWRD